MDNKDVSRRTLLEWLGRSTVVGLFAPIIDACSGPGDSGSTDTFDSFFDSGKPGSDQGGKDGKQGMDHGPDGQETGLESCKDSDFGPGQLDKPIFDGWGERTVDKQDLGEILKSWTLRVDGLVKKPRTWSFCELRDLDLTSQVTDFHCVEGWSIYDVPWDGLRLETLLAQSEPLPEAAYLKIHCVKGGYSESLSLPVAGEPKTLLGLGIGGSTLPLKHGFPCRIVVPRLYGYKNAKYVNRIELVTEEHVGFWPNYGYTVDGEVDPARLREGKY